MRKPTPPIPARWSTGAVTLKSYLDQHSLTISPSRRDDFRAVGFDRQVFHTVRGQPHLGEVIPRVTDGVHTFVELPYTKSPFEVSTSNLLPIPRSRDPRSPKVAPDKPERKETTKQKIRRLLMERLQPTP